ncbi:carboxymuconolactone decarboxylase family protein [Elongatibacter sediminis]|uniref:Peroxidase-related enzyme n=1 Tax=Elongatibacter sediminis TaxID=3119006 RepID=A0AAW9RFV2_9GAMM
MAFFAWLDDDSDITAILFHNPRRFNPLNKATQNILRGPSELSVAEREFLAAYVSGINACSFCFGAHRAVAEVYGVDEVMLTQAVDDLQTANVDPKMRPILTLAHKLTTTPSQMTRADIDAITDAGWREETAHDAVVITALFNYYNRLLDGHGIKGNADKAARSARFLPRFGYRIPWFVRWLERWRNRSAGR